MNKNKYTKKQKKTIMRFRAVSTRIFAVLMLLGGIMGILLFLRPSTSNVEKRELTKFPKLTLASFLDGSFCSDVSLWYSDTFPMRDGLISIDQTLKTAYGVTTSTMMVGGNEQGDEIPTLSADAEAEDGDTQDSLVDMVVDTSEEPAEEAEPVSAPDSEAMEAEIQNQIQKGLYVKDGAAYSVYYYSQSAAEIYTDALNQAAQELQGQADVYSILVPNNSGAMLPEDELHSLGGSDQTQAIAYYHSLYDKVKPVKTIETLREHNDEYLYFRTDHHWTQLGAYYVYLNFCEEKGIEPHELSDFETMTFSPFLGTFYSQLMNGDMAKNPDTVTAYVPMGTNDMVYWDVDGTEYQWNIIEDVSTWGDSSGYYCYIAGDKPLTIIDNPEIEDGSSCLVLKESYGNCFVPFLVDHYDKVYVVDFRYANVNVVDYVKENNIQDLIVMNNITIIASDSVASTIAGLL
ncbi:MAG TPA: hypothetical protein IAA21_01225 [Candidatus Blautia faecigallinarum]|uniref:AlgX/AlgJ SGNH hydrolase-like domain-containing protein n=1 Tax=Candidatus Blautia faecigallinarum TaxID=2838488 RepID=A0A9D2ISQ1_9FIRM|nr:hypothetical protein [Candidatus Blautia faecigallinarum]